MTFQGRELIYPKMPATDNVNRQMIVLTIKTTVNFVILRLIHYIWLVSTFMRQWLFRIPALSFNKTDSLAIQADARNFKKLPIHLGMIILEEEFSYADIANLVLWSAAMGISFISIYNTNGNIKRHKSTLDAEITKQKCSSTDSERCKTDIQLHSSLEKNKGRSSSQVDVFLLALKDGRQSIVNMAKHICNQVSNNQLKTMDLTPHLVDTLFQEETGYPDADLVIRFGRTEALMGFMPWHIRLTEILSAPTHVGVDYKTFKSLLLSYGNTEQRFGK